MSAGGTRTGVSPVAGGNGAKDVSLSYLGYVRHPRTRMSTQRTRDPRDTQELHDMISALGG